MSIAPIGLGGIGLQSSQTSGQPSSRAEENRAGNSTVQLRSSADSTAASKSNGTAPANAETRPAAPLPAPERSASTVSLPPARSNAEDILHVADVLKDDQKAVEEKGTAEAEAVDAAEKAYAEQARINEVANAPPPPPLPPLEPTTTLAEAGTKSEDPYGGGGDTGPDRLDKVA